MSDLVRGCAWVAALKEEMDAAKGSMDTNYARSLYQLPLKLRCSSPSEHPYTPSLVSIGPKHHGDARFASMEIQKLRYLASFITRNGSASSENILMDCAREISMKHTELRECYGHILSSQGPAVDLDKILLVDGCFILELFIRFYKSDNGGHDHPIFRQNTDADDPLLNVSWTQNVLRLDLALLENQIPFFILEDLFRRIAGHEHDELPKDFVANMALGFFKPLLQNACFLSTPIQECGESQTHLLHILLSTYKVATGTDTVINIDNMECNSTYPSTAFIPSASVLKNSNMIFIVAPKRTLPEIEYANFVFKIPPLHLTDCTESFLSNLMAFEYWLETDPKIASYVALMSQLIQNQEDVNLLQDKGIIINGLGNGLSVLHMFQRLVTKNMPSKFCFKMLCYQVNKDLERCHCLAEVLKRGYLRTKMGKIRLPIVIILLATAWLFTMWFPWQFFVPIDGSSLLLIICALLILGKELHNALVFFD
ncbi:UPF0481 protein At3g47200-like isoform X2 [Chenopodium quinoa]|uniref:UPF0481 protein At3g47200-like isoform X2 n=1 Tax=Chenopodium quinoa TaxID=63459 RepID=UPI000B77EB16|nr:UPF0481 protein At3g47200-like isoform X2 [Chenopodium quinoa]